MNATEFDLSPILGANNFVPFDLSNNAATLGDNAGKLTWDASKEAAGEICLLNNEERKEAFRDFVRESGGWTREEIAKWDDVELNALLLQWIAGDIREAFGDVEPQDWDWERYQEDAEQGRVSSRLFKADDGKVWFSIAS